MKQAALANYIQLKSKIKIDYSKFLFMFIAGLISPLGFAPFHLPGLTLLGLSLFFALLLICTTTESFILGFTFGMAYFGVGVSWVINSIHDYGQMNYFLSVIITLFFLMYLSLFPASVAYLFKLLNFEKKNLSSIILFSALWCLSEYVRSNFLTGFPWLLVGTTQIDTPLRHLGPILGIYGLSIMCCFASAVLTIAVREHSIKRYFYLVSFVLILITPSLLKNVNWTDTSKKAITIGAVQANLSMRDKWDEALFWNLLKYYENATNTLLGKQLIILPESAIPLPASYLNDYLVKMHRKALKKDSAILLGILQPTNNEETNYFNSIITLGQAQGEHVKQQLVPFGEYIPRPFVAVNHMLNLPEPNILPGKNHQQLITIFNRPIATLICYEIAYPDLLRQQMPEAQWIVSISDNGWFGKSLASYQQLQMSQLLSLITGRFQVVVNNDGLSSVINSKGDIIDGLPPFSSGVLQSEIFPSTGTTPWIFCHDYPALLFCTFTLILTLISRIRNYPPKNS